MPAAVAAGPAVGERHADRVDSQTAGLGRFQGVNLLDHFAAVADFRQRLAEVADRKAAERRAERRLLDRDALFRVDRQRQHRLVGEIRLRRLHLDRHAHRAALDLASSGFGRGGVGRSGGVRPAARKNEKGCKQTRDDNGRVRETIAGGQRPAERTVNRRPTAGRWPPAIGREKMPCVRECRDVRHRKRLSLMRKNRCRLFW